MAVAEGCFTSQLPRFLSTISLTSVSVHNLPGLWLQVYRTSWQVRVAEQSWETRQGEEGARVPLKELIFPCWSKSSNVPLYPTWAFG